MLSHIRPFLVLGLLILFNFCTDSRDNVVEDKSEYVNDPHSYAEPNKAKITHLDWEAEVDFENQIIKGEATFTIEKAEGVKLISLDSKGLKIHSVSSKGEELQYELSAEDEYLGSVLDISVNAETEEISISYETSVGADALQWLSPEQTAGKKHPFLFTQSQAILARTWIPIQDSPGIRFTYSAKVTVPKDLMALMSAENPIERNDVGVYEFQMKQPIPAYLMALAVGDIQFQSVGERTGVYAEPSLIDKSAYEFGEMEQMLVIAEDLYGPYQWERYDLIVLPPSFPFGGMENPRLTFATPTILAGDRSLTSLVAHELAHSWSGNLVTNATWNDFWLNEGFTTYFENRIVEALNGRDFSEMLAELSMRGLESEVASFIDNGQGEDTKLKLNLAGRNPDDGVTTIAYDKGYFFIRTLEEMVGREKFDNFLKTYFSTNAFKVMTTESFLEYLDENLFEANNIERPDELYDQWVYGEGLPDELPKVNAQRFELVDAALQTWQSGTSAKELGTNEWSTQQWLHFLNNLPVDVSVEQLSELDNIFGLTQSGNAEILTAWFIHTIRHNYKEANSALETFLINTGRRKFLSPLYTELAKTEDGKIYGLLIYEQARPNYHSVSYKSIDTILGYQPS